MSQRLPAHRPRSWTRNKESYQCSLRPGISANRYPRVDYGLDNFSYDEDYLPQWQMPNNLAKRLPKDLHNATVEWQYAGAAVCTALERIKKLDEESLTRGYPDITIKHLLRRPAVRPIAVGVDATNTPPTSYPVSPIEAKAFSSVPALSKLSTLSDVNLPPRRIMGMESPPFTPVDSVVSTTPAEHVSFAPAALPDAYALAGRLSPLSLRRDSTTSSSGGPQQPAFDQNSWETYLSSFQAELEDIRRVAWTRFRGRAHEIRKFRIELDGGEEAGPIAAALDEFDSWWAAMKTRVADCESLVHALELPTVERMMKARIKKGLWV